jgi:hypothetical protein
MLSKNQERVKAIFLGIIGGLFLSLTTNLMIDGFKKESMVKAEKCKVVTIKNERSCNNWYLK